MHNNSPIGIFDSGVGGLTVANAISKALPDERIIYFGDTAHLPYGDKSPETILEYSRNITKFLVECGCKAIVIACNSASAVAYEILVEEFNVPIFNVIDPIVEEVSKRTHWKKVGVIGTKATIRSNAYEKGILAKNSKIEVASLATPLLVPMIEEGFDHSHISDAVLNAYLSYPDFHFIDAIILGCTHYPILKNEIEAYFKGKAMCLDSTVLTANFLKEELIKQKLTVDSSSNKTKENIFYVSDITQAFEQVARRFYGHDLTLSRKQIN